ncbi:endolytic transglycosylase MltG [Actinoplanes sp. RD1]|uniref:endolytic transglycosylase MltG n=1 Tax=Actinoplanes sp. RD1 TaxID=3064538 RepID=UPI0027411EE4|nr:endolytic transglycosylase MltG [Actinoplanes sp. RD1]
MIDELDLAFDDDQADKTKARHRRRGGGRTAIAFLLAFVLLGVLGVGGYLGYEKVRGFFTAADYDGSGADPVQVTVKEGSLTEIGNTLVESDVVKSTAAFIDAAEANPRGKNIQPGTYNLKKQMSAESAVALLLDPKARVVNGVTIKEGWTTLQVYDALSKKTGIGVKDFQAAAKDPKALGVPDAWFTRRDGKKISGTAEGFLFPDTYEFPPKATAAEILSTMVGKFVDTTSDLNFVDTAEQKMSISPYEALIIASLAQAEAGVPQDMAKIARVAINRAYVKKMPLQFDVTTNYWLTLNNKGAKHSGKMTTAELEDPKNPYTTELKVGLPLGPINNPGKQALQAAVNPTPGDWLFFVLVDPKTKVSAFAVTNAQHDANIQKACANGVPLC